MRPHRRTTLGSLVLLAATSTLVAACGSDSTAQHASTPPATTAQPAEASQLCAAAAHLSSAVQTVVSDLQAGNVRAARAALPRALSAAENLTSAMSQLQAVESGKLRPQVEALKLHLQQARDASSPAELRTALTQAASTAGSMASTLRADLRCPSPSG